MRDRLQIEVPDMSHLMPVRLRIEDMKGMSDAELLAVLNGESGRKGMMTGQTAQLIASELQARAIDRASKPHWSTVPSFWLLVISVVLSLSALAVAVVALPQVQQHVFPSQQQPPVVASDPSTKSSSQPASPPSATSPTALPRK